MTNKELDVLACKYFVCPNLVLIDQKGKELQLKDTTIKRAKDMAIEYFKKTYRTPNYSSAKRLLPSFMVVASVLEGDRIFQKDVAEVFGTTNVTITKWYRKIVDTMDLNIVCHVPDDKKRKRVRKITRVVDKYSMPHPDFDLIDEGGKILGSDRWIVERVKDIAIKYFNKISYMPSCPPTTKTILPALFYLAYIIENDRRTQMDIAMAFDISESNISVWYKNITSVIGLKIIYGCNRKVLKVLEIKG